MRYGSLFSGIGGFDLGFDRAGMECAWQVEYDRYARGVLKRHWPEVTRYKDVRNVGRHNLEPVDLICGGFPCQDVSVAGNRAGLDGERSGLWFEFHRILEELTPRWCVIENVPGLLSSNGGRDFAVILRGLADIGYSGGWRVLDSQYFGVPQRRRRVFIVGYFGGGGRPQILLEPDCVSGHPAPSREAGKGVAGTLEARTKGDGFPGTNGAISGQVLAFQSKASINNSMNPSSVSPSIDVGKSGGLAVFTQYAVRRLTPTECERLQAFPDGWTAGQSDSQRYKQLGNAVTVNVAEWLGRRIMEAM